MSNLYNMNKRTLIYDPPFISWKGKAFTQITSILKRNNYNALTTSNQDKAQIFNARPLKIYRKEIAANMDMSGCHSTRSSVRIDEINRPNGSLVYNINSPTLPRTMSGVTNYVDLNLPNNKSELPASLPSCNTTKNTTGAYAFSQTQNALKRVRSSGMIRRQFSPISNKPTYYTDTTQYLVSRNKTMEQNQFNYFNSGNSTVDAGTALASSNTYYGNGTSTCGKFTPVFYKPNNPRFSQQGGVSASASTNRLKYDTLTNSAYQYGKSSLGASVANAMSYGVSEQPYTLKDKIGYPMKRTPVINKYNGKISCVQINNGIGKLANSVQMSAC